MLLRAFAISLLLSSAVALAADRGPSTPAERKQALAFIATSRPTHSIPNLNAEIQWVLKWTMEIPIFASTSAPAFTS